MKKLRNSLFGSLHSPIEFGKEDEDENVGLDVDDSELFVMDRSGNKNVSAYGENGCYEVGIVDEDGDRQRKPAWLEDDEEMVVSISKVNRLRKLRKEEDETVISGSVYVQRLRAHHAKLNPGTDWDEESDVENGAVVASGYNNFDNILKSNEELVVKRGAKLLPGLLEYSKLVDANAEDPSSGPVNSVQFHRNHQLLLAAGLD